MVAPITNFESHKCMEGHEWDGKKLSQLIDPSRHEVQFPQYIGKPCLCQRLIWNEELCGCAFKKWEGKPLPNPKY